AVMAIGEIAVPEVPKRAIATAQPAANLSTKRECPLQVMLSLLPVHALALHRIRKQAKGGRGADLVPHPQDHGVVKPVPGEEVAAPGPGHAAVAAIFARRSGPAKNVRGQGPLVPARGYGSPPAAGRR